MTKLKIITNEDCITFHSSLVFDFANRLSPNVVQLPCGIGKEFCEFSHYLMIWGKNNFEIQNDISKN